MIYLSVIHRPLIALATFAIAPLVGSRLISAQELKPSWSLLAVASALLLFAALDPLSLAQ
jgi:hypothetical protein